IDFPIFTRLKILTINLPFRFMLKHSFILSLVCISILAIQPLSAQRELFEKADNFYASHLYKEAIVAYEKALASNKEQPTAIVRLAESYYMTNNLKKAELWYAEAIKYS